MVGGLETGPLLPGVCGPRAGPASWVRVGIAVARESRGSSAARLHGCTGPELVASLTFFGTERVCVVMPVRAIATYLKLDNLCITYV